MTQPLWPSTTRRPTGPLTWTEFEAALSARAFELEPQPSTELLAEFREAFGATEEAKTWQEWGAELEQHAPQRDAGDDQADAGDSSAGADGEGHSTRRSRRKHR